MSFSYQLPSSKPTSQSSSSQVRTSSIIVNSKYGKPTIQQTVTVNPTELSHAPWTNKTNHIPRAARTSCGALFTDILERIIKKPDSRSAWNELLQHAPAIPSKPRRSGPTETSATSSTSIRHHGPKMDLHMIYLRWTHHARRRTNTSLSQQRLSPNWRTKISRLRYAYYCTATANQMKTPWRRWEASMRNQPQTDVLQ